jgi:uncharacterized protein involved in copper resistance
LKTLKCAAPALALFLGIYTAIASLPASAAAHQGQMPMMGHGQSQMPMMGHGQMPMMGHGQMPMMGHGQMPMMGHGMMPMMGHGMMRRGMGGQGKMAPGMGPRVVPIRHVSTDEVRHFLEHRLDGQGYKRLKVGPVEEKDNGTIVAEIVTAEGSLVQRFEVDRHTGIIKQVD